MSFATQRNWVPHLVTFLVWLLTSASLLSAQAQYLQLGPQVIEGRLKRAPGKNEEREVELAKIFREAGCQPSEQPVKGSHQPNVICVLPGSSDSVVVVGAHFDKVAEGDGIVDDWSGAALLPSLYQSLALEPRAHTFVFVGFTDEEKGLVGSESYVKHLTPEQRKKIAAMVNLECLGLSTTEVWVSHSDAQLVQLLDRVANNVKLPLNGVNVEQVGTADSESFAGYKIPRITIHSVTQQTLPILHSKADNIKALNEDFYYDSYRLIANYLTVADGVLKDIAEKSTGAAKPQ